MIQEGFYNDNAQLTARGNRATEKLFPVLQKLFTQARTPLECIELERAIHGDVSISSTIRILKLWEKKTPIQKGKGSK